MSSTRPATRWHQIHTNRLAVKTMLSGIKYSNTQIQIHTNTQIHKYTQHSLNNVVRYQGTKCRRIKLETSFWTASFLLEYFLCLRCFRSNNEECPNCPLLCDILKRIKFSLIQFWPPWPNLVWHPGTKRLENLPLKPFQICPPGIGSAFLHCVFN